MEEETKRPRGNPNFIKKKTEPMADTEEKKEVNEKGEEVKETPVKPVSGESTPPPAPDTLPSDLFSDKMPGEENLPLDGLVKTKEYASLPIDATETSSPTSSTPSSDTPTPTPIEPPKTPEELLSGAKQTAMLLMRGYEKLHSVGRWAGKVDQGNLTSLHTKEKINLNQVLPLGKKSITVQEFFNEYNQGIDENIVVSQEFKDAALPPLERICFKRGWIMSDELFLGVLVAEDLSTKVSMLVGLKRSANLVLDACKSMMAAQHEKKEKKEAQPIVNNEHPQ